MNRLEDVRNIVDKLLDRMMDRVEMRCGFVHLYGVSATAVLIARERGLNEEIAAVTGMLHDLVSYETGDPTHHGLRSAARARHILRSTKSFSEEEIGTICSAITHHSEKDGVHGPYEELLKDADVLQHDLYNPAIEAYPNHLTRRERLRRSLQAPS